MTRLRILLRLMLCVLLAGGGPTHASMPWSTPAPTMRTDAAPCHDAMQDMQPRDLPSSSPVPHSHDCCGPDACHCLGAPALVRAHGAPGSTPPVQRASWIAAVPATYVSPAIDASLRPPID